MWITDSMHALMHMLQPDHLSVLHIHDSAPAQLHHHTTLPKPVFAAAWCDQHERFAGTPCECKETWNSHATNHRHSRHDINTL
jgi:hypothetical protein